MGETRGRRAPVVYRTPANSLGTGLDEHLGLDSYVAKIKNIDTKRPCPPKRPLPKKEGQRVRKRAGYTRPSRMCGPRLASS